MGILILSQSRLQQLELCVLLQTCTPLAHVWSAARINYDGIDTYEILDQIADITSFVAPTFRGFSPCSCTLLRLSQSSGSLEARIFLFPLLFRGPT